MRLLFRLPLLFLIVFLIRAAVGQSPNGTISGLVLDPSGRAIAEAELLIVNDVTGIRYPGATNGEGIYAVPNLPPGPYRIQVSKVGFKTLIKPDITLNVQDALAVNFTLPIGAASETVTVEGGAPMVNTTDGSVSTVVDQNYVKNMPLNGRSFQDLILLTPGSVTQSPQNSPNSLLGQTGEFSVNGQRPESNYYTVDGVSANVGAAPGAFMVEWAGASGSVPAATALGTTQGLVSVDDLQEFRVQSSTYSAEFGRNPGGQFSFETKSGTKRWHGTAYDYLRNGVFDANDWFSNYLAVNQPAVRQNDFGGTFGGPLRIPRIYDSKDKTFFFVSYEGLRLVQPQAGTVNDVPDAGLRANTPAPLQQALNAFPLPNGPDLGSGIAEFIGSWSNPSSLNSTSVRLDHTPNSKLGFFLRFGDTPSRSDNRVTGAFATPSMLKTSELTSRTYTAGVNFAPNSHVSNELRFNYSSNRVVSQVTIDSFGGSTPVDLAQLAGLSVDANPSIVLLYSGFGIALGQPLQSATQRQWNFVDTVSFSYGRHQLKFGADYRRLSPVAAPFNPLSEYLYLSESSVESNSALAVAESFAAAYPLYQNFSAFAQDEWRESQRFNLSLGLRWELNPAPGVTKGLKPYTIQGSTPSTWTLAPQGTPLWQTTWYNFAPRVGMAYKVHEGPGSETVLRGGAGVFFDTGQQMGSLGYEGPGFGAQSILPGSSFPISPSLATPAIVNPPVAPYNAPVGGFPRHLQLPYTIQWNATLDQALGKAQALTLSYVGSHAARLLQENEFSGSVIGNPNASSFFLFENGLTSDYDALQLQFRRRLSQGLTTLASYTWSHCIDYGSQNYLFAYQRGDCDFDVRQNVSAAVSYDIPNVGKNRWLSATLHQWGIDARFSARTAFPVSLDGSTAVDPVTGQVINGGLDLVPGEPVYLYGSQCAAFYNNGLECPGGRAINPDAFTPPVTGAGNAPRNFVRGFGAQQVDVAFRRSFGIYEGLQLQFRAEAFNIFNHANFGRIDPTFGDTTFGQATGTLASTLGILSPLYQMGGARSMQFALKLIF
ncbi:MAG: carboxypeptidase regulatory-like domain-containing protein [Terriglobales bacterium]